MTRLILLRHGQSEANERKIFSGQWDFPLTELGVLQAELAAKYLVKNEKIDVIYSSDLQRAYNTALPVSRALGLPIIKDRELREFDLGRWTKLTREQVQQEYFESWNQEFSVRHYPGGEYAPDAFERSVRAITRIAEANPDKCVLIAAHAGVIRSFDAFTKGYSKKELSKVPDCHNAAISIYEFNEGISTVIRTDIIDHLDGDHGMLSGRNFI